MNLVFFLFLCLYTFVTTNYGMLDNEYKKYLTTAESVFDPQIIANNSSVTLSAIDIPDIINLIIVDTVKDKGKNPLESIAQLSLVNRNLAIYIINNKIKLCKQILNPKSIHDTHFSVGSYYSSAPLMKAIVECNNTFAHNNNTPNHPFYITSFINSNGNNHLEEACRAKNTILLNALITKDFPIDFQSFIECTDIITDDSSECILTCLDILFTKNSFLSSAFVANEIFPLHYFLINKRLIDEKYLLGITNYLIKRGCNPTLPTVKTVKTPGYYFYGDIGLNAYGILEKYYSDHPVLNNISPKLLAILNSFGTPPH